MATPYEFIDEGRDGILRIVLRNHWNLAIVERFKAEEQAWWSRISGATVHGRHQYLLIDASEHGIQSKEIVEALRDHIEHRKKKFDRTAIVITGALHQMQAGRVRANSDDHRVCGSMEDALAWLRPAGAAS